jgi:hypothetical protein
VTPIGTTGSRGSLGTPRQSGRTRAQRLCRTFENAPESAVWHETCSSNRRLRLCHVRPLARGALPGLLAWLLSFGCGKRALESDDGAACRSDSDCTGAQRCAPLTSPRERPMMAAPCMVSFTYCTTSADCSNGQVCWPLGRNVGVLPPNCFPSGSTCGPPCTSTNNTCLADEVCEANGECRLPACDEANAMPCPDHWRCDPAAAETETIQPVFGANEGDSPNYGRDAARGCARIGCDEAGGFTCKNGWMCDSANATDPSGCMALPCAVAGSCSDDTRFICEPTSSAPRPMGGDAHGCVLKNCEEGYECHRFVNDIDVGYCDFEGPLVDVFGCAWRRCDEPGSTCTTSQICEPASSFADPRGCVNPMGSGSGGTGSGNGGSASGQAGMGATGQGGASSGGSAGSNSGSGGIGAGGGSASGGSSGASGSAGTASDEMAGRCVDR